jgi:cytochrome P450
MTWGSCCYHKTLLTTIEWTMTEILRNPSVRECAQSELDNVTGCKRNIRESDMPKLEYLSAIIAKSFRLHPPAPLLMPHETTVDCKISGYDIPANTQVLTNIWAYGRDPLTWENPLDFNPDRFLNTKEFEIFKRHNSRPTLFTDMVQQILRWERSKMCSNR